MYSAEPDRGTRPPSANTGFQHLYNQLILVTAVQYTDQYSSILISAPDATPLNQSRDYPGDLYDEGDLYDP